MNQDDLEAYKWVRDKVGEAFEGDPVEPRLIAAAMISYAVSVGRTVCGEKGCACGYLREEFLEIAERFWDCAVELDPTGEDSVTLIGGCRPMAPGTN